MKKQLLAVAVASAFASTAFAANVDVYGVVDTGLVYSHTEFGGEMTNDADTHSFTMDSGVNAGSRFGLRGTEDLGDGYSVSFQLENGFDSDTGALGQDGRLFGREARLSLNTPFGTVSFGRMGALTSGAGTYDIFQATGDSLDGGNANYIGTGYWFSRDRYDNMVTLVTPEANGFTGYAQYSFNQDGQEDPSVRNNNRYAALGLTYKAGALEVAVVADMVLYSHGLFDSTDGDGNAKEHYAHYYAEDGQTVLAKKVDDATAISLGVNYDFGVTKAFFGAQYGKNEMLAMGDGEDYAYDFFKGYNLHLGAATPLPCGTLTVSVYYGDYENVNDNDFTAKKYGIGLMHNYPVSKRTTFYTGAGYAQTDVNYDGEEKEAGRMKGFDVTFGLTHKF